MMRLKILTPSGNASTSLSDEEAAKFIDAARRVWEGSPDTMLGCVTVASLDSTAMTIHIRASAIEMISVSAVPGTQD